MVDGRLAASLNTTGHGKINTAFFNYIVLVLKSLYSHHFLSAISASTERCETRLGVMIRHTISNNYDEGYFACP